MSTDKISEALAKLDELARKYDHHDYGLPLHDRELVNEMRQVLASLVQPGEGALTGWISVPVEPTVEMLTAGANATELYSHSPRGVWAAMLDAAPPPGITSTQTGDSNG